MFCHVLWQNGIVDKMKMGNDKFKIQSHILSKIKKMVEGGCHVLFNLPFMSGSFCLPRKNTLS